MGIKVTLRKKTISGNRQSLYLDIYPPIPHPETGILTRREFLGLYLLDKAKNPFDKQNNKETLHLAESIRAKRENNLNKPEIYTEYEREQLKRTKAGEQNFIEYFKELTDKREGSNHSNWISAYRYIEAFTKGNLKFSDINEKFCSDFKEYLLTTYSNKSRRQTLSRNSASSYFNKFKAALKQAYKDELIFNDLNVRISPIKEEETRRNFLTIEELNTLVKTKCNNALMKNAALFSALTGLRFSDIENLVWDKIEYIEGDGYYIKFTQQKTKNIETMPISEQAFSLLGEPKGAKEKVFEGLRYSAYENIYLAQWIEAAGITKKITFHCFRHTFATLQLSNGTDIYTVSKMLGHRDLKTTQIYAKIIDQSKRDAANRIKLDFNN